MDRDGRKLAGAAVEQGGEAQHLASLAEALWSDDLAGAEALLRAADPQPAALAQMLRQMALRMQSRINDDADRRVRGETGRFRRLLSMLPVAAFMIDRLGAIRDANGEALRLFALDPATLSAAPSLFSLATDEAAATVLTGVLSAAAQTGRGNAAAVSLRDAAGRTFRMDLTVEQLGDDDALRGPLLLIVMIDVTEQLSAMERFRAIFDNATDAILTIDRAQNVRHFNAAAEAVFRIPADQAVGAPLDRFLPDAARQAHRSAVDSFATGAVSGRRMGDLPVLGGRRADGETFAMEAAISRSGVGDDMLMTVVVRDVTERERAAAALRESEQRFRQLAESIDGVFWLASADHGALYYLSPAVERIWGRSVADFVARPALWFETIHPDDLSRVREAVAARPNTFRIEYRIVRPDGAVRWVLDQAFPVSGLGGAVERVAGVATDITERYAERARLRLLEGAVARLNDLVIITEAEPLDEPGPRIVYVNDAFVRRTGYAREEVVGRSPRILQGPGADRAELDRIRAALAAWSPVRAELINYTKAGEPFWLELDIVPLANEAGWFTHWVAVERDVTERRSLEEQLRRTQRLEALGQLTGGVAHDFNNLLTVIMGNAEMLLDGLDAANPQRAFAETVISAAERGADLTRHLLAFARKQPLQPEAIDLNALLEGMADMLARTIGAQITIRTQRESALWTAQADRAQMENAILNLVLNARDAMPDGGLLTVATGNVVVTQGSALAARAVPAGEYAEMAIADDGDGIEVGDLEHVLEPFFTTKGKDKGSGLGLAMVYGFVKQSRGELLIDSAPGVGTTVRILLPRHRDGPAARIPGARAASPARGDGAAVLLVEDDALVRANTRLLLQQLGYAVVEAQAGAEALSLLRDRSDIAVVLTDFMMPGGMSGLSLATAARALRPDTPVVLMSGYAGAAFSDGAAACAFPLLQKPFHLADLAIQLSAALRHPGAASRKGARNPP